MDRRTGYFARLTSLLDGQMRVPALLQLGRPAGLAGILSAVVMLCACDVRGHEELDHMKPPPGHGPYTGTVADWPLWFVRHGFGSSCFSVQHCVVDYAGVRKESSRSPLPSIESLGFPLERILYGSHSRIRNFPGPASVEWVTVDGVRLSASVDIARIFADRMIRHSTAREEIPEDVYIPEPEIILVVNDRTIDVYMRAWIPLKEPKSADRPLSNFNYEAILVSSETY